MKYIPCTVVTISEENGGGTCIVPSEPLPANSLRNVYDSVNNKYVVYEIGDTLPEDEQ